MRTICVIFLWGLIHSTERFNCLRIKEAAVSFEMKPNIEKLRHPQVNPSEISIYLRQRPRDVNIIDHKPQSKFNNLEDYYDDFKRKTVNRSGNSVKIKMENRELDFQNTKIIKTTKSRFDIRKYFYGDDNIKPNYRASEHEDEKDANIKSKISTLVDQAIHDTEIKVKSVQRIKENLRQKLPYKAGFIISMIKKSRDIMNELFNIAVKHKDDWKALEELKIFELVVHTNVDVTNLVRQLEDVHAQHLHEIKPPETNHAATEPATTA